jgi:putative ABC transport system substrate-binding protein
VIALSRRQFVRGVGVMGLGLLAACARLPFQESAQQLSTPPRIGVLTLSSADTYTVSLEAFRQGLRALGHAEGRTFAIEARNGGGALDRIPGLARELVGFPVTVILAQGANSALAAKQASTTVPIVFVETGNPMAVGLVASLAEPGGNITGLAGFGPELAAKRLELLKEAVPQMSRVAVLRVPSAANIFEWADTEQAARVLGLELHLVEIPSADDLPTALVAIQGASPDALLMLSSPWSASKRTELAEFAVQNRLPTMFWAREHAVAGGLMAYGSNTPDQWRRAAVHVDKILKGAKPGSLPVEQPTTFDFVINLRTAQALGLSIPQHVLLQATEVLQ